MNSNLSHFSNKHDFGLGRIQIKYLPWKVDLIFKACTWRHAQLDKHYATRAPKTVYLLFYSKKCST